MVILYPCASGVAAPTDPIYVDDDDVRYPEASVDATGPLRVVCWQAEREHRRSSGIGGDDIPKIILFWQ